MLTLFANRTSGLNIEKAKLGIKPLLFVFPFAFMPLYLDAGEVGTTAGVFTVNPAGQANYSVNIEVPPGIAGTQPNISISYSSGQGNGLLGLGGSLNGLSSISRCGASIAQDGYHRPVQLDKDDFFCFNGQKLVQSNGAAYGGNGTQYHTLIESYQLVTSHGAIAYPGGGSSPESFSVLGKGGSKLVFGADAGSRTLDPVTGVPSAWRISYLEDKHGNRIDYIYQDFSSISASGVRQVETLPISIRYGRNDAMSVSGNLFVDFVYQNRPDSFIGFRRGQQIKSSQRLANIQTRVGNEVVRDYRVEYEQAPVSGSSRIKTITECAGSGRCLMPISFNWQEADNSWISGAQKGFGSLPEPILTNDGKPRGESVDLNNDGWVDWVTAYRLSDGTTVQSAYLRDGSGWQADYSYTLPEPLYDYQQLEDGLPTGRFIDINSDALPDFIVAYSDINGDQHNTVYLNTGSGWQAAGSLPVVLFHVLSDGVTQANANLLDVNQDALPDLVQSVQTSDGQILRNTWLNRQNNQWELSSQYRLPVATVSYLDNPNGTIQAELFDVDADGIADIVQSYIAPNGAQVNRVMLGQVGPGGALSWSEVANWALPAVMNDFATSTQGVNRAQLLDINGDGLVDFVQAHRLTDGSQLRNTWLNTGLGWTARPDYVLPTYLLRYELSSGSGGADRAVYNLASVGDLNDDGMPDVLSHFIDESGVERKQAWLRLNGQWVGTTDYFTPLPISEFVEGEGSKSYGLLMDVNNDGRSDQVYSREGNAELIYLSGVFNTDVSYPALVAEFRDGFNNSHSVEYSAGLNDGVYSPDSDGVYPNIDLAGPTLLVKRVSSSDGAGGNAISAFSYQGKKANLLGRGDLGYRKKTATDERTGITTHSEYIQQWPFTGSLQAYEKRTSAGQLIEESLTTFESQALFGGLTFINNEPLKTSARYELDGSLVYRKTHSTTLDSYGNIIRSEQTTQDNTGTYRRRVDTQFDNDLNNWRIGLPNRVTKTAEAPGTPSISAEETYTYSGYRLIKKVLQPNHPHALTEEYEYNGFGHITQTTVSAANVPPRVSSSSYSADGRFAESVTNALGHTASAEYHPHFGLVTRSENANGQITLKLYDDFARQIKETQVRLQSDAITFGATDAQGDIHNVNVFHMCDPAPGSVYDSNGDDITPAPNPNCPDNAAYYAGAVGNDGESPETVFFDSLHREVRSQTQGFDGTSVFVDIVYDGFGRKLRQSLAYFKGEDPRWTVYEYDLYDRVVKVTRPDGSSITQDYQGNTSVATNLLGQTTTTTVDARGKPILVVDNLGNTITYSYDAAGNLLTTTDVDNNTITLVYDELSRKISQDDPDLGLWEYRYDAYGQVVWQKDAKGQITVNEYDVAGRLIKRIDDSGETLWEYDTAEFALGKLARVSNNEGYIREHKYDQYSRAIETAITFDSETHVTETGYINASADKVDYIRYPSGLMVRKTYNEYGFPLEVRSNGLVEYEQYLEKIAEAESFQDQAVVYQNDTLAERQTLYDEAVAEETLGNQDQRLANRAAEKAAAQVGEYNRRVGELQSAYSKYNRQVKQQEDIGRRINAKIKRLREIGKIADKPESELRQYSVADLEALLHESKRLGAEIDSLEAQFNSARDAVRARLSNVRFKEDRVEEIANVINGYNQEAEGWIRKARAHYRIVEQKSAQIKAIDDEVQRLVDQAKAAAELAEDLLAQYQGSSLVHWEAVKVDAEGRATEFKQGKHVTTYAGYSQLTGHLETVFASSQARTQEQNTSASYSASVDALRDWISSLQTLSVRYQSDQDLAETTQISVGEQRQVAITNAQYYRDNNDIAMALLEDAEQYRLDVEFDNQQVIINLNQQLVSLTDNALSGAQSILASHDPENEFKASLLDVSFYQAVSDYHSAVEALFRQASDAQSTHSTRYRNLALQTPDGISALNQLAQQRSELADYNSARQLAHVNAINRGFGSVSADLQNQYTDEESIHNLGQMVADVYQGRGDIYLAQKEVLKNLFDANQGMQSVVSQIHELEGNTQLSARYSENSTLGDDTIAGYEHLGYLFLQRATQTHSQSDAIQDHNLDAQYQASFGALSSNYRNDSELYQQMAEPIFWQNFFNQLGDSQVQNSAVFLAQAQYHNKAARDNEELMEDARNELDHSVLGFDGVVLDDTYTWDAMGNLTQRRHGAVDLVQSFEYDGLNRLIGAELSGEGATFYELTNQQSKTYQYDALGNITYKSDVGNYEYGGSSNAAGPHAVISIYGDGQLGNKNTTYQYDANGNMVSGDGRSITYSAFNKPVDIQADQNRSQFVYGPERQLVKDTSVEDGVTRTTHHFANYEKITEGFNVTHKYHITAGPGSVVAVLIDKDNELPRTHYLHRDHLDSIVAITDERGFVMERFHYDAFGQRHTAVGVLANAVTNAINLGVTSRGFTGHKMLSALKLIHMQGRIFDPVIGRFLSADPFIQFAGNTQSYNRYSYVLNNPLALTDPSGYLSLNPFKNIKRLVRKVRDFKKRLAKSIAKRIKKFQRSVVKHIIRNIERMKKIPGIGDVMIYLDKQLAESRTLQAIVIAVATYFGGPAGAAAATAHITYVSGGSVDDIRRGARRAYITSTVTSYISSYANSADAAINIDVATVSNITISVNITPYLGTIANAVVRAEAYDLDLSDEIASSLTMAVGIDVIKLGTALISLSTQTSDLRRFYNEQVSEVSQSSNISISGDIFINPSASLFSPVGVGGFFEIEGDSFVGIGLITAEFNFFDIDITSINGGFGFVDSSGQPRVIIEPVEGGIDVDIDLGDFISEHEELMFLGIGVYGNRDELFTQPFENLKSDIRDFRNYCSGVGYIPKTSVKWPVQCNVF